MSFQSIMRPQGVVLKFPEHTGERVYMEPFTKAGGLPDHLSRWQRVVDQMMANVHTDRTCYIMIDQGIVVPDKALRREGLHIDGYWHGGHHGHRMEAGGHRPGGDDSWRWKSIPEPSRHKSFEEKIGHTPLPEDDGPEDWSAATFEAPEAILLASDLEGCIAYTGTFDGPIGPGGDCSHVDIGKLGLEPHVLRRNRVYAGNVTALHESRPIYTGPRTLVRINTPGWSP